MNEEHRALCASAEWAEALEQFILPWGLEGVELGRVVVEFGPGFGITTELLAREGRTVTAVELDPQLAAAASDRVAEMSTARVLVGDATRTGLPGASADAVVCFTMLHHVPTAELQDALFAEALRLLRPDGIFAGSDSLDAPDFRKLHDGDVCLPIPPETLADRLRAAGFETVEVETNEWAVRFRAKP